MVVVVVIYLSHSGEIKYHYYSYQNGPFIFNPSLKYQFTRAVIKSEIVEMNETS